MDTTITTAPNGSLRQRMLQDMKLRGLGAHTQQDYIRHVRSFVAFLGRPPDTASAEDLRRFQLDQHRRAVGPATINAAVSALRFLFTMTVDQHPKRSLAALSYSAEITAENMIVYFRHRRRPGPQIGMKAYAFSRVWWRLGWGPVMRAYSQLCASASAWLPDTVVLILPATSAISAVP